MEYLLKNTGKTEIDHMYFSSMMRNVSILEESHCELYYNNNLLNIYVLLEKNIKPGGIVKVKINYVTDRIIVSNIGSATLGVWLIDENKRWWTQSLFAPENKIYNSEKTTREKWREETDELFYD